MGAKTSNYGFSLWDTGDRIEVTANEQTANWNALEDWIVKRNGYLVNAKGGYRLGSNGKPLVGDATNATIDDQPAIQAALTKCKDDGGGIVFLPAGNYALKNTCVIYSNTTFIMHPQARIYRNKPNIGAFFRNGESGSTNTGYNGHGNIHVIGGYLDGNIGNYDYRFNFFSFGHGYNITFENIYMKDTQTYHAIEINSTNKAVFKNLTCDGYSLDSEFQQTTPNRRTEAIQIDGMYGQDVFGDFGAYDNTPCNDITIESCTFRNWNRGVGSHSSATGAHHRNIRVVNNHFENIEDIAVVSCMWDNAVIDSNTFQTVGGGVWLRVKDSTDATFGYVISNNTFRTVTLGTSARHAIRVSGQDDADTSFKLRTVSITGNTIENTTDTSIYVDRVWRTTITGNTINNATTSGIYVTGCEFGTISANTIISCGSYGIGLSGSNWFAINGNLVSNTDLSGIYLTNSKECAITGNTTRRNGIAGGDNQGIRLVSGSSDCTVTGNSHVSGSGEADRAILCSGTTARNVTVGNNGGGKATTNNSTGGVSSGNL
ncbi:tailspike [Bacillus phage Riggi]|uniref:Tailspike n=1 Tax=Bacillus phage Riggi TaxID=2884426 RepID=U5PWQ4_9CAUD|nr:tail spike protein [Bacillus phage Riggi]AGY48191.1 tailspike [Bacillus phage Riggi]